MSVSTPVDGVPWTGGEDEMTANIGDRNEAANNESGGGAGFPLTEDADFGGFKGVNAQDPTNPQDLATRAYVLAVRDALIASAPGALDTLDELAAALGDDANFATTVTNALAGKQPLDTDLTAIAALVSAANKLAYATGSGTWALTDLSAFARTLLDDADAPAMLATLGTKAVGSGTSFPGSPANNDLFYRTDLDLLCFYDGTRWLTVNLYRMDFPGISASISASAVTHRGAVWHSEYDLWLDALYTSTLVATTNTGTHNWTITLYKAAADGTPTSVAAPTTAADAADVWVTKKTAIEALLGGSTYKTFIVQATKNSSPGNLLYAHALTYRLVVP